MIRIIEGNSYLSGSKQSDLKLGAFLLEKQGSHWCAIGVALVKGSGVALVKGGCEQVVFPEIVKQSIMNLVR